MNTTIESIYTNGFLNLLHTFKNLLPIAILFIAWELASGSIVEAQILPAVSDILVNLFMSLTTDPEFLQNVGDTLLRWGIALILSSVFGVIFGISLGHYEWMRRNFDPIISITFPSPKSPLIPLVIFWLGTGHLSRIFLGFLSSVMPIIINASNSVSGVKKELIWSAKAVGLRDTEILYKIIFPASLPTILTGIRIGLIFGVVTIIASEMIIAESGIGTMIMQFGAFGQYESLFAVILFTAALLSIVDRLFVRISDRLLVWSESGVGGI